jgi:hypothetical protein
MDKGHDLDLGEEHFLDWVYASSTDKTRIGATITFPSSKHTYNECFGLVSWAPTTYEVEHPNPGYHRPLWTLETAADETITISPSVLCMVCGDHGFIRNGKWVRA